MPLRFSQRYSQFSPIAKETFRLQLVLATATGPLMAMVSYAAFVVVKTFHAPHWVPVLTATIPISNLLAIFFADRVTRSNKIDWIVWPNILAALFLIGVIGLKANMGPVFALLIVASQLARAPIVSAQSAVYRENYGPHVRSWAMAMAITVFMAAIAIYSLFAAYAFEQSERWIGPIYALTGLMVIAGAWRFRRLRLVGQSNDNGSSSDRVSLSEQIGLLVRDRGFRGYQISYMLFGGANIALITAFPIYLFEEFSASHASAMQAIIILPTLASIVMLPVWGTWFDRHRPLVIRLWICVFWSMVPLIYYFSQTWWGIYFAAIVLGLMRGGNMILWHLGVNYFAQSHNVAHYMGLHQTLTGIRGFIMPVVAWMVGQWIGFRESMLVWFVIMAMGGWIMWLEIRREKRLGILRSFQESEEARDQGNPNNPQADTRSKPEPTLHV